MKRRVVITGVGAVTPIGNTVHEFWKNAKKGVCGIDTITAFEIEEAKVNIAAELKDFQALDHFKRKQANRLDRFSQLGLVAAREAYQDAKLDTATIDHNRLGVSIGTGVGGISTVVAETTKLLEGGMNLVSPLTIPKFLPNILTGNISMEFGAYGISNALITACSAGTNAIGEAFRAIQYDDADMMICGASEACITPFMLAGFTNLGALSVRNDPKRSSIPFDKERDGFVMGEGAGMVILEELNSALIRNAKIYGEVVGYGFTSDAYHLTAPEPSGKGGIQAMKLALKNANIQPEEISYINAHGTSTPLNDRIETDAIKEVFKEQAYQIPISSTKSMIGHLLGASGAVEAIACLKSLEDEYIHPTIGFQEYDEECDLDYCFNEGRQVNMQYALSNSFGFGGHNATLIFKKWTS